jgi:hypothetical protein
VVPEDFSAEGFDFTEADRLEVPRRFEPKREPSYATEEVENPEH